MLTKENMYSECITHVESSNILRLVIICRNIELVM